MTSDRCFAVNVQHVAHDLIDGEVIAVHLVNGNYFSLQDSAAWLWQRLVEGHSLAAILAHLQPTCVDAPAVEAFVNQLVDEDLVLPQEGRATVAPALPAVTTLAVPVLEKHVDMQELIAIDPIHEVGDGAWPHRV